MVRRRRWKMTLSLLALLGVRTAAAGSVSTMTGNVAADFTASGAGSQVGTNSVNGGAIYSYQPSPTSTLEVSNNYKAGQDPATWFNNRGTNAGVTVKDIAVSYDSAKDTLAIGVNFFGVAGDVNGTGTPGNLLGKESITLALSFDGKLKDSLIMGVPNHATSAGTGLGGFNLTSYSNTGMGIEDSYGKALTGFFAAGQGLQFQPSSTHPGFEVVLQNASKLPGFNANSPFDIAVYAGSSSDSSTKYGSQAEDSASLQFLKLAPQTVPEPATILAWSLVAAGAGFRLRNRRRAGVA